MIMIDSCGTVHCPTRTRLKADTLLYHLQIGTWANTQTFVSMTRFVTIHSRLTDLYKSIFTNLSSVCYQCLYQLHHFVYTHGSPLKEQCIEMFKQS